MTDEETKNLEETNKLIEESLNNREDKIIHIADFEEQELAKPFPTGFNKLDECILGGVRGGDLVLLSGLSKHGKSQISLQMTKAFSDQAIPVLWFTFEMPVATLRWRFKNMYKNDLNEKELLCYMPKKNVSDKVEWLENRIVEANEKFFTQIVIIDNLDFLTVEQKHGDDKLTMQKRIVGMLKRIALDLNVVIILNAHVSKLPQGQKRPKMSNIYGASETYKLADLIIFIYRKQEQESKEQNSRIFETENIFSTESELIVDGNRLTGINRVINLDFKDNIFKELNY